VVLLHDAGPKSEQLVGLEICSTGVITLHSASRNESY